MKSIIKIITIILLFLGCITISLDVLGQTNVSSAPGNSTNSESENNLPIIIFAPTTYWWGKGKMFDGFDPAKEVISKRDMNSKHFENDDGSYTAVISLGSVHYKDENGFWQEIDNRITETKNNSSYKFCNKANSFKNYFPADLKSNNGVKMEFNEGKVSDWLNPGFCWIDNNGNTISAANHNDVDGIINENTISYASVFNGTDVKFTQKNDGKKMDIILTNNSLLNSVPTNAKYLAFYETISIPSGWKVVTNNNSMSNSENFNNNDTIRAIRLYDSKGKAIVEYTTPYFYDNNYLNKTINRKSQIINPKSQMLYGFYKTEQNKDELIIYTFVPFTWLTSPDREFPITIDPTTTYYPTAVPGWVQCEDFLGGAYYGYPFTGAGACGSCQPGAVSCADPTYGTNKSAFQFNISSLYSACGAAPTVTASTVKFYIWQDMYTTALTVNYYRANTATCGPVPNWGPITCSNVYNLCMTTGSAYVTGVSWPSYTWTAATELGATAHADISAAAASGYFAIGCIGNSGTDIKQADYGGNPLQGTDPPQLTITYNCPCTAPSITTQPGNATICSGGSANFSVTASGTAPLSYQWKYNASNVVNGTPAGAIYTNQTTATMTVSGISGAGVYSPYTCYISNACGNVTSATATLTVLAVYSAGAITGGGGTICSGNAPGTMTANPSGGAGTYTYQWQSSPAGCGTWTNIPGATSQTYAPPALTSTTCYQVLVDATGSPDCGAQTASTNTVTVTISSPSTTGLINTDFVWSGNISAEWNIATNWLIYNGSSFSVAGAVPGASNNIFIRAYGTCATNIPTISTATGNCNSLTIETGKTLIMGGLQNLNINNNCTNNGTFTCGNGMVTFTNAADATVSGSSSTTFYDLTLNKGTGITNILNVTSPITVSHNVTTALSFTNGLLSLNAGSSLIMAAGQTIGATSGLQVNGGTLVAGNYSITNNGLFKVISGTANIGTSNGNSLNTQNGSTFIVSGGTLNIAARLVATGSALVTISGGNINLATVSHTNATYTTFDIYNTSTSLSISSGTITLQNANSGTAGDINVAAAGTGTKTISGGTFIIGTGSQNYFVNNSAVAFYNLTINCANVTFNSNAQVNSILTLTNGSLILNAKTLTINNSATGAIVRDGSTSVGYILSSALDKDFNSKLQWNISTTQGAHVFPFGIDASTYIPFTFNLASGGNCGNVIVSTYPTGGTTATDVYNNKPIIVANLFGIYTGGTPPANAGNIVRRFWLINTSVNPITGTAAITFTYGDDANEAPITGEVANSMVAQQYNISTNNWQYPLSSQTSITASNTVSVPGVINFSPWTITRSNQPLPIELLNFTATCRNNVAEINWTTATEINNDYFTLEKCREESCIYSADGWETISIIKGAGNSNTLISYSFTENSLSFGEGWGKVYYRLKQTDYNGQFAYSGIIATNCTDEITDQIKIYPNPATDELTFSITASYPSNAIIQITDITGRKVIAQTTIVKKGTNRLTIDISGLNASVYLLQVITANESYKELIIKK